MRKACLPLIVAGAMLVPAPAVLGALPRKGAWAGVTSQGRAVKFSVPKRRRSLRRFEIGTSGPPPAGVKLFCSADQEDYVDAHFTTSDVIRVDRRGRFSTRFETKGKISKGSVTLKGRFRTRTRVRGTVHWRVKRTDDGRTCESRLSFTATRR